MPYQIEHDTTRNCLLGTVSGEISAKEAIEISNEGMEFAGQYPDCHTVLLDFRQADFKFSMTDIFYFPRLVGKHAAGKHMRAHVYKTAIVVTEKSSKWSFLETVNYNVGMKMKVFTGMAEAEAWLAQANAA